MACTRHTCLLRSVKDLTGLKVGLLTVLSLSHTDAKGAYWNCACECGTVTTVRRDHLGYVTSCGCYNRLKAGAQFRTHGMRMTKEYRTWCGIIQRCENPNNHKYSDYGGRGITICERWRNSFENFLSDMGPAPSSGHSIDRVDNDKGYGPDNCRWADRFEQGKNKRSNRLLTHEGRTMPTSAWAEEMRLPYDTLSYRINHGWTVEKALTTPPLNYSR